jgi:hypothetical protein
MRVKKDGGESSLYRIIAASRKRMATQNTANTEKNASECTIFFYCLDGIRGTGRDKTATWREQRGNTILVYPDHTQKYRFRKL